MPIELKVPPVGESITEVTVGDWLKAVGDAVAEDTPVVVVESDKVNLEVPAPRAGVVVQILKKTGETAKIGEVIGLMEEGGVATPAAPSPASAAPASAAPAGAAPAGAAPAGAAPEPRVTPAARRVLAEHGLEATAVTATGPGGRVLKEDVLRHVDKPAPAPAPATTPAAAPAAGGPRRTQVVRMSPLRKTVARRLVEAQQTAALLTTFNEVDMSAVMALRKAHQERFLEKHGVKLGFMSFFVKAAVDALRSQPAVNARIEDDQIVYHDFCDIGVAVGGGKGLVVPVLRNAELLSFAEIEKQINDFGVRAKENRIKLEELSGGTFSITNGGVYGSLLSTPIINPPQSGILGMHGIQDRPVARDGQVVIRPMMYIALTYDHRLVDGREAVTFLKRIKELVEEPVRLVLEV